MARRTWDLLSANYRRRLERNGVTRSAYESGASLSGARGHAKTPERPERARKHPEQYPEYTRKRQRTGGPSGSDIRQQVGRKIVNELLPWLESRHMDTIRRPFWSANTAKIADRLSRPTNPVTHKAWKVSVFRQFLAMSPGDFGDINWTDPEWSFVWYH